jgi:thiamine biosynthesis protein ThiI
MTTEDTDSRKPEKAQGMTSAGAMGESAGDIDSSMLVLRLGEVFLKGANRPFFLRRLKRNVQAALEEFPEARLESYHGRMLVHHPPKLQQKIIARLQMVFGLSSISPAVEVRPEMEDITEKAVAVARSPESLAGADTFAVRTHRSDKSFPLTSPEVSRRVGDAVGEAIELAVDLTNPDLAVEVEIGPKRSFVFSRRFPGAGGLPVGVSGKVCLLLSGGIDSPVAGWLLLKRGLRLSAVTFHSPPHTGPAAHEKVVRLCRLLCRWGGSIRLHTVRFTEIQQKLRREAPAELAVLLYRRMMVRTATKIALKSRAKALVTGESLGQVASQTLENLSCIQESAGLPILRPLIGYDKKEIMDLARKLTTYEISIEPHEDCCSLFVPKHPETRASIGQIRKAESGVDADLDQVAEQLAREAEIRDIDANGVRSVERRVGGE